ncbi:MAG TPA: hypothetical protein VHQ03_01685 [Candidatus Dormibacteraeota bacterium]|nr:hypothetical protein [Candidatus Dormibacteraeota bacterium]
MGPPLPRVLLLVGVAAACHRSTAPPFNPRAEVAVTVQNQNFLDMDVFVVRGAQRIRIGMVPGISTRILMVRPELVGLGAELRFEVHPIGGRGNPITETISVRPGDVVHLTIPPN